MKCLPMFVISFDETEEKSYMKQMKAIQSMNTNYLETKMGQLASVGGSALRNHT